MFQSLGRSGLRNGAVREGKGAALGFMRLAEQQLQKARSDDVRLLLPRKSKSDSAKR